MPTVLQGQIYKQTAVEFGAASVLPFEQVVGTGAVQLVSFAPGATRALPCNVKVVAVAVEFESTTPGTQVPVLSAGLNISSGVGPTGTTTFGAGGNASVIGTASAAGTAQINIVGPTPGTSQSTTIPVANGQTAAQVAAALAAAVNAMPNPQVYAVATAVSVTITPLTSRNLLAAMGGSGKQQWQAVSATPGITLNPSALTNFPTAGSAPASVGTPDNFATSTPTSVFAGPGQFLFSTFRTVTTTGAPPLSPNLVQYPALIAGVPGVTPFSLAEYDIVFPCTRGLTVWLANFSGFPATIIANVSVLVMPVILDPNQPYPAAGMWVPNNTNLGAPSTA